MKLVENNNESNLVYKIIDLNYYHSNCNKTLVKYEKNGIKKAIELNGILDKEKVLHILRKRNY